AGNLYIADLLHYRVRFVAAATGVITTIAGTGQYQFSGDGLATATNIYPVDVAVDGAGNLLIADDNARLRRLNLTTHSLTTVAGNGGNGGLELSGDGGTGPAASGTFSGVAAGPNGVVYVVDREHDIV